MTCKAKGTTHPRSVNSSATCKARCDCLKRERQIIMKLTCRHRLLGTAQASTTRWDVRRRSSGRRGSRGWRGNVGTSWGRGEGNWRVTRLQREVCWRTKLSGSNAKHLGNATNNTEPIRVNSKGATRNATTRKCIRRHTNDDMMYPVFSIVPQPCSRK